MPVSLEVCWLRGWPKNKTRQLLADGPNYRRLKGYKRISSRIKYVTNQTAEPQYSDDDEKSGIELASRERLCVKKPEH